MFLWGDVTLEHPYIWVLGSYVAPIMCCVLSVYVRPFRGACTKNHTQAKDLVSGLTKPIHHTWNHVSHIVPWGFWALASKINVKQCFWTKSFKNHIKTKQIQENQDQTSKNPVKTKKKLKNKDSGDLRTQLLFVFFCVFLVFTGFLEVCFWFS